MARATIDGIDINYRRSGAGEDVVLIHGLGANMAFWPAALWRSLALEHHVTAYDLRGHGYSDMPPAGYTTAQMAVDLRNLLDATGVERAHIVGHSYGGAVALHFAVLHPQRVLSLTLADARIAALQLPQTIHDLPHWKHWWDRFHQAGIAVEENQPLDYTIIEVLADPRWRDARRGLEGGPFFVPFGGWNGGVRTAQRWLKLLETTTARGDFRATGGLTREAVRDLDLPVLAIYGEHSHCLASYRGLQEILPRCRALLSPGSGHFHPAVRPDFFGQALRRFLAEASPRRIPMTRKKNILLIGPDSDNEALWVSGEEEDGVCEEVLNNFPPLGLATVAGLTPGDRYNVDLWDELVHGRIDAATVFERHYDLIGVTGYKAHLPRCREVAAVFRARGIPVVIGGPGVSASPDEYRDHFDTLFVGEVEKTWPRFLADWEAGAINREYRQIDKLDLADSPPPRWDSIAADLTKYAMGGVQTTRGCPFDCEFCDVIYLYGRRARHKPIATILDEIGALQRLGVRSIFFCDDEFIGDRQYAKELLRAMIPLNNSFPRPLSFSTQLTMNLSKDDELLELMADANFNLVFIGIETPNKESLKETHKHQNVRDDLAADVIKILSYGISIRAGIIVGFDHDGPDIFDIQYEFIQRACLPSLAINMLKAPLGTRLWSRLRQEGRVVSVAQFHGKGHPRTYTNILPKMMTRLELLVGYRNLLERLYRWEAFSARMTGLVSAARRPPRVPEPPLSYAGALRLCLEQPGIPASSLPVEGRSAIEAILRHTEAVAPWMMRRVKILIVQHVKYLGTLAKLLPQCDLQIEVESRRDLKLQIDNRAIPVPVAFRAAYPALFPEVHRRVWLNLADKSHAPEALTDVFVDFLVRWGDSFERLEPYHRTFLKELGDRTCARLNGLPPESFIPIDDDASEVPEVRRIRLGDDVLKAVEQTLVTFVRSGGRRATGPRAAHGAPPPSTGGIAEGAVRMEPM